MDELESLIYGIRKIQSFKYDSIKFINLFEKDSNKNKCVINILSSHGKYNHNYDSVIKDITDWYLTNNKKDELIILLQKEIPRLEVNKNQKESYYKNGEFPTVEMKTILHKNGEFDKPKKISNKNIPKTLIYSYGIEQSNLKRDRIRKLIKLIRYQN
jgi:hypothetical protein